jgi:hypothetical protein
VPWVFGVGAPWIHGLVHSTGGQQGPSLTAIACDMPHPSPSLESAWAVPQPRGGLPSAHLSSHPTGLSEGAEFCQTLQHEESQMEEGVAQWTASF